MKTFEKYKMFLDSIKIDYPGKIKNVGESLDDPVLTPYTNFFCFLADRDPTFSEPDVYHGYDGLILFWVNTSTGKVFISIDNLADPLIWNEIITDLTIANYLPALPLSVGNGGTNASTAAMARTNLGLNINSSRSYSPVSLSLNTSRQPNTTNDTFVSCNVLFTSVLSLSSVIELQDSPDNSNWTKIGKVQEQLSVASTTGKQLSALIPAGHYYKIVQTSGSGASIDSILELTF